MYSVEPPISGPRLSGNLVIRTNFGGNGIFSLYLYSHIWKFVLPYFDINFGHQMTNSFVKVSRKSWTPEMIASLMFMFWLKKSLSITCINSYLYKLCHIHDILLRVFWSVCNMGREFTISAAKVNQLCEWKIISYPIGLCYSSFCQDKQIFFLMSPAIYVILVVLIHGNDV